MLKHDRWDPLNSSFTFDTFVVCPSNRLAYSACRDYAENVVRPCNQILWVRSPAGQGKTHLLHAIAHSVRAQFPRTRFVYYTAEMFSNDFINSIKDGRLDAFRCSLQDATLLLFDDLHFLVNGERTQAEFLFHLKSCLDLGRRVVVASFLPPLKVRILAPELQVLLNSSFAVDVEQPDIETRKIILKEKAKTARVDLPDDCLNFIVDHFSLNVREMEGALMIASARSGGRPISLPLLHEILQRDQPATADRSTQRSTPISRKRPSPPRQRRPLG